MDQHRAQSTGGGFPVFERPSEAVVFWMLGNLCREAGGKCSINFADLARRCSLAQSTVKRVVHGLARRRVIRFHAGCNQYQGSVYEVVCGNQRGSLTPSTLRVSVAQDDGKSGGARGSGGKVSHPVSGRPKIGQPNPSDSDSDSSDSISIGDNDIAGVVHNRNASGRAEGVRQAGIPLEPTEDPSEEERLAFQVADGLEDVKNLRLYESYCRRFPAEVILAAYVRAREVSPDKIKKSRGALFNFLVQKYGGKNKNNSGYSGSAPWSARDGRGRA